MDENSCENETSESVDGQEEKKKKNVTELENSWVKTNHKDNRKLNQVLGHGRYSFDASGPSTDFSPATEEDDNGGKITPSVVNVQAEKSKKPVEENETGTRETIKEQDKNRTKLKERLALMEENAKGPQKPSASMEVNAQSLKILPAQYGVNSSLAAISSPGHEKLQEVQARVRLAPNVEKQLATRTPSVGPPPSYSFVMKQKKKMKPVPSIDPFITNIPPPPTYSGSRTIYLTPEDRNYNFPSFAEPIWRSHSQPALCPRCGIIVLTTTHTHDSKATHVVALALCLLGCWPCCLLPYCMNVCKNTYHHCPICQTFLGLYRPW